jgi:cytoskeletal protein CcmA (bactofilin family)
MWNRERDVRPGAGGFPSSPLPQTRIGLAAAVEAPRRAATIGESVVIKGELTAEEDLLVTGCVEGRVSVEGHVLTIGPKASILADVRAGVAIVGGAIRGSVSASDKVEVLEGGSVEGDITTPRIAVADGGRVRGRVDMPPAGT